MPKGPQNRRRALSFEPLESRLAMAGAVVVKVAKGNLTITGDNNDNLVAMVQTAPGEFDLSGAAFAVNGAPGVAGPVHVTGVTKDIKVNLKQGNDEFDLTGTGIAAEMANNVSIKMGGGGANVSVSSGKLGGKLTIDAGQGDFDVDDDDIELHDLDVAGAVAITTGKGSDQVHLVNGTYRGNVTMKTGTEGDGVILEGNIHVGRNLVINLGSAFEDSDILVVSGTLAVAGNVQISSANGDDEIDIGGLTAKKTSIKTGTGSDSVSLDPVTVDQLLVSLGTGDDDMDLSGGVLTLNGPKKSKISGGSGDDDISGIANVAAASLPLLATTSVESVL